MSFPGSVLLGDKEILIQTSTQRLPLGTRGYTNDGRAFRYARCGATALAVGKVMQNMAVDASLDLDQDLATSTLYACAEFQDTDAKAVYIRNADTEVIAADTFKEGYLYLNDELGEGQMVRLKGNEYLDGTINAAAEVEWRVNFADDSRLSATISTATLVGLLQNKYDDVIITTDGCARTGTPLGVTPRAVTATYYFWLQTWGPCVVLVSLAITVGGMLGDDTFTATGTSGALHTPASNTLCYTTGLATFAGHNNLARVLVAAASGQHALVDLTISP